jgi:hypothetical protein
MGQFSVKIYTSPGSLLSANQHPKPPQTVIGKKNPITSRGSNTASPATTHSTGDFRCSHTRLKRRLIATNR